VDEVETRQWLGWSEGSPLPRHAQLLAHFPETGKMWMAYLAAAEEKGELDPRRRAKIAWIAARHDHAWYAQVLARKRLRQLDYSDEQIFALDQFDQFDPSVASVLKLTWRLTVRPWEITDADIAAVRQHYSPQETAEIVHHIALAAFFNRLTEAAQLPWHTSIPGE
jgi:alkylhydroperoxidase family enzyme